MFWFVVVCSGLLFCILVCCGVFLVVIVGSWLLLLCSGLLFCTLGCCFVFWLFVPLVLLKLKKLIDRQILLLLFVCSGLFCFFSCFFLCSMLVLCFLEFWVVVDVCSGLLVGVLCCCSVF